MRNYININPFERAQVSYEKGYNDAIEDVLNLVATLGIDWEVNNKDIEWLEKSISNLKKC